ncbi:MAG TPA: hypothetical protein VJ870_19770 [Amycolatopsis sp.]|nr:hypothetical protein [Amycolatopsis sp.]
MRRRNDGEARRTRSAGALPVVAAVTSALALTGAAFLTVDRATCGDAQYIRHADHVELVGGCVGSSELDQMRVSTQHSGTGLADFNAYRP